MYLFLLFTFLVFILNVCARSTPGLRSGLEKKTMEDTADPAVRHFRSMAVSRQPCCVLCFKSSFESLLKTLFIYLFFILLTPGLIRCEPPTSGIQKILHLTRKITDSFQVSKLAFLLASNTSKVVVT